MKDYLYSIWRRLRGGSVRTEPLMYRQYLFGELTRAVPPGRFEGKRVLEIGPKDGLDSQRLASLKPSELVMIELPLKEISAKPWLAALPCPHRLIEANFMYLSPELEASLGTFDLIWCTGVLYHNTEQLRFLRRLYRRLNPGGMLVLESATLRGAPWIRNGAYVQIHYPQTYRGTNTITHLPSAGAIRSWLAMVGFTKVDDSECFRKEDPSLVKQRYACLAYKSGEDDSGSYYRTSEAHSEYRFGDAV